MKWYVHTFLSLCLYVLCGCHSEEKSQVEKNHFEEFEKHISERISSLEKQHQELTNQIDDLHNKLALFNNKKIAFNLRDPAHLCFEKIDTKYGFFYLNVNSVEKFSKGYKIKMEIGNPLAAHFSNVSMHVRWGSPSNLKEKEIDITKELRFASWTPIEFDLSPVDAEEELESVDFTLSIKIIELQES